MDKYKKLVDLLFEVATYTKPKTHGEFHDLYLNGGSEKRIKVEAAFRNIARRASVFDQKLKEKTEELRKEFGDNDDLLFGPEFQDRKEFMTPFLAKLNALNFKQGGD